MAKTWYSINALAGAPVAEVMITDAIGATWDGDGVTAKQFINDVRAIKSAQEIRLTVSSPGGLLFEGVAIANALRAHAKAIGAKTVGVVLGVAASAATLPLMACDRIEMPANAYMMVHKASSGAWGTADEMRDVAAMLDTLDSSIVATYAARTGKSTEDIAALLSTGDVWMTAAEAKAAGFVDEVIEERKVTNAAPFDVGTLPAHIQAALRPAPEPAPAPTPEPSLTAKVGELAAAAGLADHAAVFALDPRITSADTAQAVIAAAQEVRDLAVLVGKPDQVGVLLRARSTVAQARESLAAMLVAEDNQAPINNVLPEPNPQNKPAAKIGPVAFWANH